jgi:hypothetical protein
MAENGNIINYGALLNEAMHSVVREALRYVEGDYAPGPHSFYISFLTNFRGVVISNTLKKQFPHELTIVLQHEFRDLFVEEDRLCVTLSFNNKEEKLCVPYSAILKFHDPAANIELTFVPAHQRGFHPNIDVENSEDSIKVKQKDNVISLADFKKNNQL